MTTVLTSQQGGANFNQNNFRILYDNFFDQADTVVASSEDGDFPIENAYDWLPYDFFKPSASGSYTVTCTFSNAKTVNCMAFTSKTFTKKLARYSCNITTVQAGKMQQTL